MFLTSWYSTVNLDNIVCGEKKLPPEDPLEDMDDDKMYKKYRTTEWLMDFSRYSM